MAQAIADVAAAIKAGFYTVGLAGGVETMSANPMAWEGGINPRIEQFPKAQVSPWEGRGQGARTRFAAWVPALTPHLRAPFACLSPIRRAACCPWA